MQKKEVIIDEFIKTIKDLPADATGDPEMLSNVFDALDKKKKKRRVFGFFILGALIILGLLTSSYYYINAEINRSVAEKISTKNQFEEVSDCIAILEKLSRDRISSTEAMVNNTVSENKNIVAAKNVTYTFSKHKIDVIKDKSDAFIQINVFGVDGAEKDFLKIVEELKSSYHSNELIVDSVKQK